MVISIQKARALCTDAEYTLVQSSTPRRIKALTPAKLKQKIDRARKLRDKFKDLARQQSGEARGKRKPTGTRPAKGNDRTIEKVELFDQVLSRFEAALAKSDEGDKSTAKAGKKKPTQAKKAKPDVGKSTQPTKLHTLPGKGKQLRSASITSESPGQSFLDGFGSSLAQQQSREARRQAASKSSKGAREQNRLARTSAEKIQGHVSASTRRSQAKRDSK